MEEQILEKLTKLVELQTKGAGVLNETMKKLQNETKQVVE